MHRWRRLFWLPGSLPESYFCIQEDCKLSRRSQTEFPALAGAACSPSWVPTIAKARKNAPRASTLVKLIRLPSGQAKIVNRDAVLGAFFLAWFLYDHRRMKCQTKLRITAVLISIVWLQADAEPISQLRSIGYVNDFAHVLNGETASQLEDICQQIDQKARAQIAVVTVNSLDGSDIEGYAVDLFKKWGIGNKATNRGVLILLAVNDRRYRIEVGYGLEPILPDGKVGGFGREAVPYLRNSDYDAALLLLTTRVAGVVAKDAGVQITTNKAPPTPSDNGTFPVGTIVFLIILAILIFGTPLRSLLFWWLLFDGGRRRGGGNWGGGNWGGGWGGGGFGSGGGFGGFGGGSSGGGGASGSW